MSISSLRRYQRPRGAPRFADLPPDLVADEEDEISQYLHWECQVRKDRSSGEDLLDDDRLRLDENYAIRSWMAVVSFLMSDYEFLYE